jgi:hypothetical protein
MKTICGTSSPCPYTLRLFILTEQGEITVTLLICFSKNLALGLNPSYNVFPLKTFRKLTLFPSSGNGGVAPTLWDP